MIQIKEQPPPPWLNGIVVASLMRIDNHSH